MPRMWATTNPPHKEKSKEAMVDGVVNVSVEKDICISDRWYGTAVVAGVSSRQALDRYTSTAFPLSF